MFNFYNNKELKDKSSALTSACGCLTSSSSVAKIQKVFSEEYNTKVKVYKVYFVKDKTIYFGGKAYKIDLPDGFYIIRKLTPIECERLQTLPDNYTQGISNTQRYKCLGNGWTVDVIANILSFIPKEEI